MVTVKGQVWHPCTACNGKGEVTFPVYVRVKGIHRATLVTRKCKTCNGKKGKWV